MEIRTSGEDRIIFGRASTAIKDGIPVVDSDKHRISPNSLEKAARQFMSQPYRPLRVVKVDPTTGLLSHGDEGEAYLDVGEVIESVYLDDKMSKALGITGSEMLEGWYTKCRVTNDNVWNLIQTGVLKELSPGGKGRRTGVSEEGISDYEWVSIHELSLCPTGKGYKTEILTKAMMFPEELKQKIQSAMGPEGLAAILQIFEKAMLPNGQAAQPPVPALAAPAAPPMAPQPAMPSTPLPPPAAPGASENDPSKPPMEKTNPYEKNTGATLYEDRGN